MSLRIGRSIIWVMAIVAGFAAVAWSQSKSEPLPPFVTTVTFE